MIVTYDIADGCFDFHTEDQWDILIKQWREMLEEDGEDVVDLDEFDIFEAIHGDEVSFDTMDEAASVVTYDIANGCFDFHTDLEWVRLLKKWRKLLERNDLFDIEYAEDDEFVELYFFGDVVFCRSHDFEGRTRSTLK